MNTYSRDGMVAINSSEIRNTTVLTKDQLQSARTCENALYSYKCFNSQIRQEHIGLEANKVQINFTSKNNYRNGEGGME